METLSRAGKVYGFRDVLALYTRYNTDNYAVEGVRAWICEYPHWVFRQIPMRDIDPRSYVLHSDEALLDEQGRETTHAKKVERYRRLDAHKMPPVILAPSPQGILEVVDGRHRIQAAKEQRRQTIPAVVPVDDARKNPADHTIREDQGDGFKIATPHGFIQYRNDDDTDEVWYIESRKRGEGSTLMRLMLQHHPCKYVAWGATSEAGQAFRTRWHAQNPHIKDATRGERVPFDGQFDPYERENPSDEPQFLMREMLLDLVERKTGMLAGLGYDPVTPELLRATVEFESAVYDRLDTLGKRLNVDADFILSKTNLIVKWVYERVPPRYTKVSLVNAGLVENDAVHLLARLEASAGVARYFERLQNAIAHAAKLVTLHDREW